MLSYCLKCRKNMQSKNHEVLKSRNKRIMLLPRCSMCSSKKMKFLRKQEATRLLSSLGIRTPFSQGPILF